MRVPLELGAKLMCRWRGEEYKSCEIIERKQKSLPDGTTDPSGEWEYCADSTAMMRAKSQHPPARSSLPAAPARARRVLGRSTRSPPPPPDVHYEGLNRRLDEWVGLERFDLGSVNDDGKVTRNSTNKRKHEHEARRGGVARETLERGVWRGWRVERIVTAAGRGQGDGWRASGRCVSDAAARVRVCACQEHEEEGELDLATLKEHEEATKVKNISRIVMGKWKMETWYFSPFPKEYSKSEMLYICEYDLNFFARREQAPHHPLPPCLYAPHALTRPSRPPPPRPPPPRPAAAQLDRYIQTKCRYFHPPGDEIYRETKVINGEEHNIAIFEARHTHTHTALPTTPLPRPRPAFPEPFPRPLSRTLSPDPFPEPFPLPPPPPGGRAG